MENFCEHLVELFCDQRNQLVDDQDGIFMDRLFLLDCAASRNIISLEVREKSVSLICGTILALGDEFSECLGIPVNLPLVLSGLLEFLLVQRL